jgi:hypothetical protein
MTQPIFLDGFVRPLIVSGLTAILTSCAAPQQVRQASPQIVHDYRVAKTEKSTAPSKSNPRHRVMADRYTVNATPANVPKVDVSPPVQPNNPDTVRNIILKSLEKRQAMVDAIATLNISEPPLCTKQLPPDTVKEAGVMALAYGFHVAEEDFQRDVRAAGIHKVESMGKNTGVRESICDWAQVMSALTHEMYKRVEEYKRRVGETGTAGRADSPGSTPHEFSTRPVADVCDTRGALQCQNQLKDCLKNCNANDNPTSCRQVCLGEFKACKASKGCGGS